MQFFKNKHDLNAHKSYNFLLFHPPKLKQSIVLNAIILTRKKKNRRKHGNLQDMEVVVVARAPYCLGGGLGGRPPRWYFLCWFSWFLVSLNFFLLLYLNFSINFMDFVLENQACFVLSTSRDLPISDVATDFSCTNSLLTCEISIIHISSYH